MITKRIEVRDHATFIPCLAIRIAGEHWLERRAGYGPDSRCVLFLRLQGGEAHYDCYDWNDRTMRTAHWELTERWDKYKDGDLLDVRVALEETETPCGSERPFSEENPGPDILEQFKVKPL